MLPLPDPALPWPIPMAGVALVAEAEGLRLSAYKCPAGKWTCGWGETDGVGPSTKWTREYADQRFCDSLGERAEAVRAACTVAPTPNQLGALASFAYNCIGWQNSSVIRAHNRGDHAAAARAFGLWNKARNPATGELQVLNGLTTRRARESALYLTPEPDAAPERMPQAVEPETAVAKSPIAQSGGITLGAGVVSAITTMGDDAGAVGKGLRQVRETVVDVAGVPSDWFLPLVLIAAGLVVLWWRNKQRREGWA